MVKEAEANATEDKKRKDLVEARTTPRASCTRRRNPSPSSATRFRPPTRRPCNRPWLTSSRPLKARCRGDQGKRPMSGPGGHEIRRGPVQAAGGWRVHRREVPNMEKDDANDDIVDADFTEVGDDDKKTS